MKIQKKPSNVLILPDIRSAINVGAIFRTADAVGIDKIYLVGVTPRPNDQYGRIQRDIAKSALGAETWIKWDYKEKLIPLINNLKKQDYEIVALEQSSRSIDYRKYRKPNKFAFILGPEVTGLDKKILNKCDKIVEIPMKGRKESLNVSVAAGVALFEILN